MTNNPEKIPELDEFLSKILGGMAHFIGEEELGKMVSIVKAEFPEIDLNKEDFLVSKIMSIFHKMELETNLTKLQLGKEEEGHMRKNILESLMATTEDVVNMLPEEHKQIVGEGLNRIFDSGEKAGEIIANVNGLQTLSKLAPPEFQFWGESKDKLKRLSIGLFNYGLTSTELEFLAAFESEGQTKCNWSKNRRLLGFLLYHIYHDKQYNGYHIAEIAHNLFIKDGKILLTRNLKADFDVIDFERNKAVKPKKEEAKILKVLSLI
jgi:hypothetical protein